MVHSTPDSVTSTTLHSSVISSKIQVFSFIDIFALNGSEVNLGSPFCEALPWKWHSATVGLIHRIYIHDNPIDTEPSDEAAVNKWRKTFILSYCTSSPTEDTLEGPLTLLVIMAIWHKLLILLLSIWLPLLLLLDTHALPTTIPHLINFSLAVDHSSRFTGPGGHSLFSHHPPSGASLSSRWFLLPPIQGHFPLDFLSKVTGFTFLRHSTQYSPHQHFRSLVATHGEEGE